MACVHGQCSRRRSVSSEAIAVLCGQHAAEGPLYLSLERKVFRTDGKYVKSKCDANLETKIVTAWH